MVDIVTPEEAQSLLQDGYVYLDVRSVQEFEIGHATGAYNIPVMLRSGRGLAPNPKFLSVVNAVFAKDRPLVVACKMGGRSKRACQLLTGDGFTVLRDLSAGFDGKKDAFGGLKEPGWKPAGLPVSLDAEPGRSYAELEANG